MPASRSRSLVAASALLLLLSCARISGQEHASHVGNQGRVAQSADWPQLGFDAGHSSYNRGETTITRSNVSTLASIWSVPMIGTPVATAAAVYLPTEVNGQLSV